MRYVVMLVLACLAPLGAASGYAHPELLVDTAWVAIHTTDPNVRLVDMRTSGFAQGHIPGAVHLDNGPIRSTRPPTFLPSEDEFSRLMSGLGISDATRVVVYDDRGGLYAARLWLVLTAFGHSNVALLDGGWTTWTLEHRPTSTDATTPAAGAFHAHLDRKWIATADEVVKSIGAKGLKIVDARTPTEIAGSDLRGIKHGGAVPSSIPVYWEDALNPDTKTFKPADQITALYRDRGIGANDTAITYCQVGMRAAHDAFALTLIGQAKVRVYYGSWDEWGNRDDLPIAKAPSGRR
jgi:thiosulfate/3-mercaptopyruvate sulfurtransferase